MQRLEAGNKQPHAVTFEEVYSEYGKRILNMLYGMTGDEESARDLTQDVFMKVHEKMSTFDGRSSIYTWVYRIALNHAMNVLKRERRYRWLDVMDQKIGDVLQNERSQTPFGRGGFIPPDRKLEKKERDDLLWQSLQKLKPKYRLPFQLHRYEDMSYKEIAEVMDLSMSAVEARIHRAKKMLVTALTPLKDHI